MQYAHDYSVEHRATLEAGALAAGEVAAALI
jgi:hypothetical protein